MSIKQKLIRRIVFVSGMNGWSIAGMGVLGGLFSLLTGGWLGGGLCFLITVAEVSYFTAHMVILFRINQVKT